MRKIIAIAIGKGGVGKTTTAINLSACLAASEKKTLLIDFDPSGSCSGFLNFGSNKIESGIFKVFSFAKSIMQVINKTEMEFLDFISSDVSSPDIEERLIRITSSVYLFKNILNSPELHSYEYIILDCPPSLKGLTSIALTTADTILIPIKAGDFSILALRKMFDYYNWIKSHYNAHLKIEGILRTIYEADTISWSLTNEELFRSYKSYLFETVIPKNTTLIEAEFFHKPAILYDLRAPGSQAYLNLAKEILLKNRQ